MRNFKNNVDLYQISDVFSEYETGTTQAISTNGESFTTNGTRSKSFTELTFDNDNPHYND